MSAESENRGSGSSRRHIANQERIKREVLATTSVDSVEFFDLNPTEAIRVVSQCSLFIGQRGAALMNIMFLPAGSSVIEITPRKFAYKNVDLYKDLAGHLGLSYTRIWQRDSYAPVSTIRLSLAIRWANFRQRLRHQRR